jgi:hypothetical protein
MAVRPARRDHEREGQIVFGPEPEHEHAIPYFPQPGQHAHDDPEAEQS